MLYYDVYSGTAGVAEDDRLIFQRPGLCFNVW